MRRASALLVLLLAGIVAACSRPVPGDAATQAFVASAAASGEGEAALAEGDLARAAEAFARAAEAAAEISALAPWRRICLYNLACAEARRGERSAALEAFRASLEGGLPLGGVVVGGEPVLPPDALLLEHVLADPDLDAIRGEAGYAEALRPYVAAGEAYVVHGATVGERRAVIVLRGDGEPDAAGAVRGWTDDPDVGGWETIGLAGPVRCGDGKARWILRDGDERWAVARVSEAVESAALDPTLLSLDVYLVGEGPDAATAAWAAALASPRRVAGLTVRGARVLPAADADALAEAVQQRGSALPWIVLLGPGDRELDAMLRAAGIAPIVVEEGESLAVAARRAWDLR